jgi:hypothetical protein
MRVLSLALIPLLAGCASAGRRDRAMLEIPAGEFEMADRTIFLPTFHIDVEPGVAAPGLVAADEYHLAKAARYGLPARVGTRYVRQQAAPTARSVEWRSHFWEAVEEARRRNCILFVTLHWDG